jgi:uncharacterized protein YdaU (DUF1376 family)
MHYFKRNIGDYHKKAGRLTMLQHGAYTLLLDACYDREVFPTLEEAIDWSWASTEQEISAISFVLNKFFVLTDGVYIQHRIESELDQYHKNSATNKRIAQERETKRKNKSTVRGQSVDEAPPNHKPLTNKPITNKDNSSTSRFEEFWDLYGKKDSRAKCEPKFNKLKESEIDLIFKNLPAYIESTPDVKFRKNPFTWLNGKCWENEVSTKSDLIDYSYVIDAFNESMRKHKEVPVTIDTTPSRIRSINMLVESRGMTIDGFKAYFDHVSRNDQLQYFLNGIKIPARGIDHFLKDDVFLSIKEAKATNK